MFKLFTKKSELTNLEKEIESVIKQLSTLDASSEEYAKAVKNLEILYKAKSNDKQKGVSPDTIAIIAGNLLGIALILGYEKADIITSKALGFVLKGRV